MENHYAHRKPPMRRGFAPGFVNYRKGCTRLASDNGYQLLAQGRYFSPGTLASTERHDMAEILLKVVLNTINQIKTRRNQRYKTYIADVLRSPSLRHIGKKKQVRDLNLIRLCTRLFGRLLSSRMSCMHFGVCFLSSGLGRIVH
jgi:hypothetical protein